MKQRLQVWKPEQFVDGFGNTTPAFVPYQSGHSIAAERKKESGSFRSVLNEQYSDYRAEYYIYYQHRVLEGWKVRDCETGVDYIVTNVFTDRAANLRRLVCEKINK